MKSLVFLVVLCGIAHADLRGSFSPGPLQKGHAQLESRCESCHQPWRGLPNDFCLACHTHAKQQIDANKGFHAGLAERPCASCHAEHKGRDAVTSPSLPDAGFSHARTGLALVGKHADIRCSACHKKKHGDNVVWTGLVATCTSCHVDTHHNGSFGTRCEACHTQSAWLPLGRRLEDHVTPMTDGHNGLACKACHAQGAHLAATTTCGDCHEQKHGGTHAPCSSCHNVRDWKQATFTHDFCSCKLPGKHQTATCLSCHPKFTFNPTPMDCAGCHKKDLTHDDLGACSRCHSPLSWTAKVFDHNKKRVGFPIDGKHALLGCTDCHTKPQVFSGAPSRCAGCHKVPAHGDFGACEPCHRTSGWTPARFDHATTKFPLVEAHAAVRCQDCHTRFAKPVVGCITCHRDPHAGQFKDRSCATCHTQTSWKPSTIDVAAHAKLATPLRGAHEKVACARCHTDGNFVSTPTRCEDCHVDRHRGTLGTRCAECHTEVAWKPVAGFDHAKRTGMALTFGHANVACAACHGAEHDRFAQLRGPVTCATCHTARHGAQFGPDCTSCHDTKKWSDVAAFDHDKTEFPLLRRHKAVACLSCHDVRNGPKLGSTCQQCHGDPHRGGNGSECGDCHAADRWRAIRFDHDRTEYPLVGRHFTTPCISCHRNNQWTGVRTDCVACHTNDRPPTADHAGRNDCNSAGCHTPFSWYTLRKK